MKTLLKLGLALGLAVMMAEVERTPDKPDATGKEPTILSGLSAADTQLIPNKAPPNVQLRVINASAESTVVTIVTPNTVGGLAITDQAVTVGAGKTKVIGPFDPAVYNNAKGFLEVKFSKVTSITLEIVEVGF